MEEGRGAKRHILKAWPEFWQATAGGLKSFELRRNDRDYQPGDTIILQEWNPGDHRDGPRSTGKELTAEVVYVLDADDVPDSFGLRGGFCILGLKLTDVMGLNVIPEGG